VSSSLGNEKKYPYLISYYAVLTVVGLLAGLLGPVLPSLAQNTHSSLKELSLILAMRPAGYLLGTLLLGRLLDRRAGHPLLVAALLLAAITLLFSPLSSSLPFLSFLILLMGFADGTLDVGSNTLLPWVYGDAVGPYLNGMHFAFGIGALSAPLLVARALEVAGNPKWAFWSIGLLMLPPALLLLLIPSPKRPPTPINAPSATIKPGLAALVVLCFMSYGASETAMGTWIFSYATSSKLGSPEDAAYLSSLFWGSLTFGRLMGIPLALRFPLSRILRLDACGSILSLALILFCPHSTTALWLGTTGAGLSMASFFPTLLAESSRRLSPGARLSGSLTSLFFVGSSSGSIALPWIIGQGFDHFGPSLAPTAILTSLGLMSVSLFILLKKPEIADDSNAYLDPRPFL
jgi:FHS family Na+ dependent glucose MFS transporter 1